MKKQSTGILALFLVGGYFAWLNRHRIQQFLESQGIRTPLDTSTVTDTIRSGVAKLKGKADNMIREESNNVERAS